MVAFIQFFIGGASAFDYFSALIAFGLSLLVIGGFHGFLKGDVYISLKFFVKTFKKHRNKF